MTEATKSGPRYMRSTKWRMSTTPMTEQKKSIAPSANTILTQRLVKLSKERSSPKVGVTDSSKKRPTEEQEEVLRLVKECRDNLLCNSYAGTGKTTMLGMMDQAEPEKPVLFMAFNRRIADEAIEKQATGELFDPATTIKTINGMGDKICRQTFPYKAVYKDKVT